MLSIVNFILYHIINGIPLPTGINDRRKNMFHVISKSRNLYINENFVSIRRTHYFSLINVNPFEFRIMI